MILEFLKKVGIADTDSEEAILQKNFMLYLGCAMSVGGILWGTICLSLGLRLQCTIPYGYTILTFINFCTFNKTKNFETTRLIQVTISLLLPFGFQFVMGGFVASGGVMLWAIISLITALTFVSFRSAFYWLLLYFGFTILMGAIDHHAIVAYKPSTKIAILFFVINFSVISSIVFGLSYYFVSTRITALQNAENAKKMAEKASASKSEFLANMSHEIRTPLNGVIGFIDVLKTTQLDATQQQYLHTVGQSAHSLLDIVNDVLDFSKIESGKLELSLAPTNVQDLGTQLVNLTKISTEEKDVKLSLKIAKNVPNYILADELRLRQILINLIGNAIKFTHKGEIDIVIDVISKTEKEYLLRFAVRDTGIGIDKHNQEKIFEAFSQEDTSITKKYGGTGLGLTIANKMLDLMGSKLDLISEIGKGSLFYFDVYFKESKVPVAEEEQHLGQGMLIVNADETLIKTILIADDNKVNMLLTKLFLKEIFPRAKIVEARNGIEAIDQFTIHQPNMVFMDVQMPEMNGLEATAVIRKAENAEFKAIIIALTAGVTNGEMEKCFDVGMDDYLSKPFTKHSLFTVIGKYQQN
jgi:signal transduction histidine kinase/CheY-like chemotaxis protein